MPSFRSENLTIEINLSEGKFMDLIRVSKDRYLDVRVEALEVRLNIVSLKIFFLKGNLQIF